MPAEVSACHWLDSEGKDAARFHVLRLLGASDRAAADRATQPILKMNQIDVAMLEAAVRGT